MVVGDRLEIRKIGVCAAAQHANIVRLSGSSQERPDHGKSDRLVARDDAHSDRAVHNRSVVEERVADLSVLVFDAVKHADHVRQLTWRKVARKAADAHDTENDATAHRRLEYVEHALAQAPTVHEQAFEPEGVGDKAEPEDMRMDTRKLVPDHAQVFGTLRNLYTEHLLARFGITHTVAETANPANALDDEKKLGIIPFLNEFLQTAMHEPDLGNDVDDLFVLDDKVEMQRLRKHGMLRSERND